MRTLALLSSLIALLPSVTAAAPQVSHFVLVTSAGPIATLTSTRNGSAVDNDWRADDNGRGSKLKEHLELGPDGLPRLWTIEGKAWFGAPVKERFVVEGGKAKWTSLDDAGEADGRGALYLANNASPWSLSLYFKQLMATPSHQRAVVPGGTLRLEKLHEVTVGPNRDRLTAYAVWGLGLSPQLVLARGNELVAGPSPDSVFTDVKYQDRFAELTSLAADLSGELLKTFTAKYTHTVQGPLWIEHVRVFDPATQKISAPLNVGLFRDQIVSVGNEAAPDDATVVDGSGCTLLPGLIDSHDHLSDWAGPLHMATGVTFGRDPGNENASLLRLLDRIASGEVMGPRLTPSGFLEGKSPYTAHLGFVVDNVDDARAKVRWYADHGYWGIKIYNSMNPDFVKPIADEAHRLGLHVSGHVPAFMSSERAVRDGYDEINHINQLMLSFVIDPLKEDTRTPFRFTAIGERMAKLDLHSAPVQRMIALMKARKTTLDPTMATFSELLLSRPGKPAPALQGWLSHMPLSEQRDHASAVLDVKPEQYPLYEASWKKLEDTLVMLYREGLPLVPGTDATPGLMLHSELEAWVKAGIPAAATLSMATLGGARFLGLEGKLGTISRGKLADVYLVEGDPTQDITAIRRGRLVVKGGKLYFPDEIDTALGIKPFAAHAELKPPRS